MPSFVHCVEACPKNRQQIFRLHRSKRRARSHDTAGVINLRPFFQARNIRGRSNALHRSKTTMVRMGEGLTLNPGIRILRVEKDSHGWKPTTSRRQIRRLRASGLDGKLRLPDANPPA